MNTQDDLAWKREFEHVEEKQKQREGWDGKQRLDVISATYDVPKNTYTVKDNDNETNNQ